ncbi:hypothetical protein KX816_09805 [Sphingosinicellaceae bacterium]|nr:hypothetical protein KX816_09805 [Sphingosinicellaceae bacterium]
MSDLKAILTGAGLVGMGAGEAAAEHDAFAGSTLLVAGLLAILGAQEAEKAAAWRVADIRAMQELLGDSAPEVGTGLMIGELDAAWATLSAALILHHARIETDGDRVSDANILSFYRDSCARRELVWPI